MKYEQQIGYRYPKGRFAMVSVYAFTGAAILASTIFSLLLFLSIDENPMMQALFGGLAIIFEAGKFYAWYEYGEFHSECDFMVSECVLDVPDDRKPTQLRGDSKSICRK